MSSINNVNWDRVVHYVVGDKRFINPIAAWREIIESKSAFHFSLFDRAFESYNWTQEPVESWQELSRQRAQQIRDRYDWVRLWYSGGRDSDHALNSFLDNGIHIDEVVIFHNPFIEIRDHEMKNLVYPLAQEKLKHTTTKISVLTLDHSDWEQVFPRHWQDVTADTPSQTLWFQPTNYGRLFDFRPDQFKIDQTKRVGIVVGMEKPKLVLDQGNWYMQMCDHHNFMHSLNGRDNVEFFYISPDLPALHAKQTWMALNHIEKHYADRSPEWITRYQNCDLGPELYDDFCLAAGRADYTHPFLGLGQNKLSGQGGRSQRFQKYFDFAKESGFQSYRNFETMVKDLQTHMGQAFNQEDPLKGTIGILSPRYFLKQANLLQANK